MKRGKPESPRYSLDGGVLIALAIGDPSTQQLKRALLKGEAEAYTHELALIELAYILCRRFGWHVAQVKLSSLLKSRVVEVVRLAELVEEASRIKCERALSVADCCTLALAALYSCKALFARRERELEAEISRKPLEVEVEFLS